MCRVICAQPGNSTGKVNFSSQVKPTRKRQAAWRRGAGAGGGGHQQDKAAVCAELQELGDGSEVPLTSLSFL